jgi:hypothetical protein
MAETKCGFDDNQQVKGAELLVYFGPTLFVDIGFDPNHDPIANPGNTPVPGITGVQALVDSGATECCIDSMLAVQLNLPLVNRRKVSGVHGEKEVNVYLAQVRVPALNIVMNGSFCGVDLKAGGQAHNALMGRTFLRHFHMIYEGNTGTVTIKSP